MTLYFRKHSPEETWKTLQDLQVVSYKWKAKSDHGFSRVFSSLLFHFSFHKYIMFNASTKKMKNISYLRLLLQFLCFGRLILGLTHLKIIKFVFFLQGQHTNSTGMFHHQPKCISKPNYSILSFKKYKQTNIFKKPIPQSYNIN